MTQSKYHYMVVAIVGLAWSSSSPFALAGVKYSDPSGGWRYTYGGNFNAGVVDGAPGTNDDKFIGDVGPAGFGGDPPGEGDPILALDGTWYHTQGDKWDGTAPGDPLSDPTVSASPAVSLTGKQGTSPGGAGSFTEGSTTYIRVQDAGNPEPHGWIQGLSDPNLIPYPDGAPHEPINSNRRVYFGHNMQSDGPLSDELVLTNTGITLSFRARIPNSGPLDDLYLETDGVDEDTDPDVIPWFQDSPNGRGTPLSNGRGTINVVQNALDNSDTLVGFSLINSTDITQFCSGTSGALCTGSGSGGLIMNNLNGNAPSNLIDSESSGTLNILELGDTNLNEWNEFWITMENNAGLPGNIEVSVYLNGSTTPSVFQVTLAAPGNASYKDEDDPFLEFGISDNAGFGSFDLDFISYQLGVIAPIAAPREDADFDEDGDVDGIDFLIWQRGFDVGTSHGEGDANGDGNVNAADLEVWQSQYGTADSVTFAAVPEPGALALVLLGILSLIPQRRTGC